ncbi:hypothetical protein G7Z17_g2518 [Cylindrodendrum hubeiense]|uniref:FAD/NAD(P)-binding domain-containing protein n=1 Tax=Cylindrodendrum hubeiense TaxID=595255 RepID=A0A9P5HE51_9HYPO|nr:hypothetical protein G7Z17_g2518 [Cylindrodendrum hubeiense]
MVYKGQPHFTDFKAPIINRAIDDPGRKLRVVMVGTGISGVTTAIRFPEHLGENIDLQLYDKNPDIGGVWLENRYPGVACDIPAPCFQFLFENNPDWSKYYAEGEEIVDYIQRTADKYGARQYMKFRHLVTGAHWKQDEGKWLITIKDLNSDKVFEDEADVLILGWGMLNNWEWPKVPGLHSFKGPYMHSADYDTTFDPTGKTIAVVGGGSSGIQILPHIQKVAKHVDHYMRSQNWIAPLGFGAIELEKRGKLDQGNCEYSTDSKHRREVEEAMNDYMTESGFTYGTTRQQAIQAKFKEHMSTSLKEKPDILQSILPAYPPGCRRRPGYLEALNESNVDFIPSDISHVTEEGIVGRDGTLRKVDAIIWATGFNVDFVSRFPMTGLDGIEWNQVMDPEPEAYLGMCVDKMPNCFVYMGPNCGPGAGGAYLCVDGECELMISCIKKILRDKIKFMTIKTERVKQYAAHVHAYLKTSIFGQPCKSWFKRGTEEGRNIAYYCGNALNLLYAQRNPRWEDWDYTYLDEMGDNPLSWLGNGYTLADYDGSTRTKYLDPDEIDFPPLPHVSNGTTNGTNGVAFSVMRPTDAKATIPGHVEEAGDAALFGRA